MYGHYRTVSFYWQREQKMHMCRVAFPAEDDLASVCS